MNMNKKIVNLPRVGVHVTNLVINLAINLGITSAHTGKPLCYVKYHTQNDKHA